MDTKQIKITVILVSISLLIFGFYQIGSYNVRLTTQAEQFEAIPFQKGMSFTTWENFSFTKEWVKQEFLNMSNAGIEWVAINHWWWQDYLYSTEIKMDQWSDAHENMTECFQYAHSLGLHIMYKPMLNLLKTYEWRSYITFTEEWMNNYAAWMVDCAESAQAGDVEILCFGTEMGNMQVHSEAVRSMISQIRTVYDGLLTYSANHDSFMHIDWYDAIDIIGISMYSSMCIAWDPSISDMSTIWNGQYAELEELSLKWNKPILFSEIGIQATDGANMVPNDNQLSQEKDISEMRNYYLSLFQSRIWMAPWFKGVYWWIWDRAQIGDSSLKSFNPVIILDTITTEYEKEHYVESGLIPLIQALIPFALSGLLFTGILIRKNDLFQNRCGESINTNYKASSEMPTSVNFNQQPPPSYCNLNEIVFGLLLGSIMVTIWNTTTMLFYGTIQKAFSYAIILHLSTTETMITFGSIIVLALIVGMVILRFIHDSTQSLQGLLVILTLFIMFYPVVVLGKSMEYLFLKSFFDMLVLFLLIVTLIKFGRKYPLREVSHIIVPTLLVIFGYIATLLVAERMVQLIVCIPLALILHYQSRLKPCNSKTLMEDCSVSISPPFPSSPKRMPAMIWLNSLIAGILLPFGNTTINMVRMNGTVIAFSYFPTLVACMGSILLLIVLKRKRQTSFQTLIQKINTLFTNEALLKAGMVLALVGFPIVMLGGFMPLWAVLTGLYFLLYIGTVGRSVAESLNSKMLGRNYLYLCFMAIFFVLGFILNGIKGLLIYLVTFLTFKDGAFAIRDPTIDPVAQFDVPLVLNSLILVVALLLLCMAFILQYSYRKLSSHGKVRRN